MGFLEIKYTVQMPSCCVGSEQKSLAKKEPENICKYMCK